jgi:hypothetical protein
VNKYKKVCREKYDPCPWMRSPYRDLERGKAIIKVAIKLRDY